MNIKVYKTKTCAICAKVAYWLRGKQLPFEEIYIDDRPDLQQYVYQNSGGYMQVPFVVITIDGSEHYVSGGNISRISELVLT